MKNYAKTTTEFSANICEIKASYSNPVKASDRPVISKSKDAYDYFNTVWNADNIEYVEEMLMLLMNRAGHVLGWVKLSQGGMAGTVCDPKVVFSIALTANASGIILCHNHPSGNLKPSQQDISLYRLLKQGGNLLSIDILDNLIITAEGFYSFGDEGII